MENTRQTKTIRLFALLMTLIGGFGFCQSILENNFKIDTGFAIFVVSFFTFWYLGKSEKERKEPDVFLKQIVENKKYILCGGWDYNGIIITPETVITQYFFSCALIAIDFKIPSRFYVVGHENTVFINVVYSISSFILGWWSIPSGPINTIQTLRNNLKGGRQIKVADLINDM